MTDLRKAAETALDALEAIMFTKNVGSAHIIAKNARYSLRESLTYKGANEKLAQSDNQEPVAYWNGKDMFKRADEVQYVVNWTDYYHYPLYSKPVKERISEPVANLEPVAWVSEQVLDKQFMPDGSNRRVWWEMSKGVGIPFYTAPPKREWVGLTDEDWHNLPTSNKQGCERDAEIFDWIEDKLKEKNK